MLQSTRAPWDPAAVRSVFGHIPLCDVKNFSHSIWQFMNRDSLVDREISLLLELAWIGLGNNSCERARELVDGGIDWKRFFDASRFHCLTLLTFPEIKDRFRAYVPEETFREAQSEYDELANRNMSLSGEFFRMHRLLVQSGVAVVAFKGPVTAITMYGGIFKRQFGDIDLFVPQESIAQAYEIFRNEGYCADHYGQPLQEDLVLSDLLKKIAFELALVNPRRNAAFDLHWRIRPPYIFSLEFDDLLPMCDEVSLCGQTVKTFCPELLLLIQCMVGSMESCTLSAVCDIAQILKAVPDFKWDKLRQLAKRLRCEPMIAYCVRLAHELFAVPVPKDILEQANSKSFEKLMALTTKRFCRLDSHSQHGDWLPFVIALKPGIWQSLSFVALELAQPKLDTWVRIKLPEPLFFCYYPVQLYSSVEEKLRRFFQRAFLR